MANRVTFLVDGFNLYHSVRKAMKDSGNPALRWLNLHALLSSYIPIFGKDAVLEEIHYFTAYAHHLTGSKPDVVNRHRIFVEALKSTGVQVQVARFKRKDVQCPSCRSRFIRHEEKETDVAIGVKAIELLHLDKCETLVIVSGDTDVAPAVRTARQLFSSKQICVGFPHARFNAELQQIADFAFRLRDTQYAQHQFPDPVVLRSGRHLPNRPAGSGCV